jgi:MFS transporter, SHS family, lactate transporter
MQNTCSQQISREQFHAIFAAYLGWTLDAFDFFIMVFVLREVAASFHVPVGDVATAITLTLACRAVGAIIFGRLADRFGRRPILMLNIVCYALLEFCSGLAPTLTAFLVLRALFGVAMGGEWGVASSLVMESVPEKWRGLASGVLQAGYPSGYLLASLLYLALPWLGWRGMFMVGILPALLAFYVRRSVQESPAWQSFSAEDRQANIWTILRQRAGFVGFAVVLMTALNFFAHGSQDLYPSEFLGTQHKLSTDMISSIMIVANIGGLIGGIAFGMLSQQIGRKWAMALAVLLALPVLPFWASASTPLMLGFTAFLMLLCVQGAWGIVPAYLNELSPPSVRATFPGFVYQAGNFLAAANANIQIWIAGHFADNYGLTMALTAGVMAVLVALLVASGPEPKGARMAAKPRTSPPGDNGAGTLVTPAPIGSPGYGL